MKSPKLGHKECHSSVTFAYTHSTLVPRTNHRHSLCSLDSYEFRSILNPTGAASETLFSLSVVRKVFVEGFSELDVVTESGATETLQLTVAAALILQHRSETS
jgi:hypothetical protein